MFGWVASDIDAKMEILRGLKNGEQSEKYQFVQSMIQYEVDNNLIKHKAKDSSTGTRNLLRLHRALEYIVAFLEGKPLLIFFSFLEEEIVIFYTEILIGKVVLWCFFSSETSEKIHKSTFQVKISV